MDGRLELFVVLATRYMASLMVRSLHAGAQTRAEANQKKIDCVLWVLRICVW